MASDADTGKTPTIAIGFSPRAVALLMSQASRRAGDLYSQADSLLHHVDAVTRLLARFNGGDQTTLPALVEVSRNLSATMNESAVQS